MKRFYTLALSERDDESGGYRILLDGRPVKTPMRAPLSVPGEGLAAAIVAEWQGQGETIDPGAMPVTGFANATIDQVLPDVATFAATIAEYAASDLLCYRADGPQPLVEEQARHWDALLDWARGRFDAAFVVTSGIMPVQQPAATVERLTAAAHALDPWLLSALSTIVSISGSLVGSLALVEGATDADALWEAAHVDEAWQVRQWGEDHEAVARTAIRRAHYDDAARYCALVAGAPDTAA
ncbi:ATPase [Sphingobium sufflavum]|uniref:ATP12 family chaperone protein n=1 Tax=Sphingobium sufflavum TaxID=1129547 RepID=UPI001F48DC5E|nr:ATP12 family protein [Sphingobium sufflavum]MCE7798605.1 ATPase [Sphingobium sufflavum]